MFNEVPEDQCLTWKPGDRPNQRPKYFKEDFVLIPRHPNICKQCEGAYWQSLTATKH
jgi:hypothetical protein